MENRNPLEKLLPQYRVDGFDPNEALTEFTGIGANGQPETFRAMRWRVAAAWFRTVFPKGRITHTIVAMDAMKATATAFVYRGPEDTEPCATGIATKWYSDDPTGRDYVSNAVIAAKKRALSDLGFDMPINLEAEGEAVSAEEEGVSIPRPAIPAPAAPAVPAEPEKGRKKKAAAKKPVADEPAEAEPVPEPEAPVAPAPAIAKPPVAEAPAPTQESPAVFEQEHKEEPENSADLSDGEAEQLSMRPALENVTEAPAAEVAAEPEKPANEPAAASDASAQTQAQEAPQEAAPAESTASVAADNAEANPVQEHNPDAYLNDKMPTTVEEAYTCHFPYGATAGQTIREVAENKKRGPKFLRWHLNKINERPGMANEIFATALQMVCEELRC